MHQRQLQAGVERHALVHGIAIGEQRQVGDIAEPEPPPSQTCTVRQGERTAMQIVPAGGVGPCLVAPQPQRSADIAQDRGNGGAAAGGAVGDRCGAGEAWGCGVAAVLVHAAARERTSAVTPARDAAIMRVIAVSLSCPLSFSLG